MTDSINILLLILVIVRYELVVCMYTHVMILSHCL